MYRIYLDVCCLNRPFDDQTQLRIRLESEAIVLILSQLYSKRWIWIGGDLIRFEISQNPDIELRKRVQLLAANAHETVALSTKIVERGRILENLGMKHIDALHVACAEYAKADVMLTTDDRFQKVSNRLAAQLYTQVVNPLNWLQEFIQS